MSASISVGCSKSLYLTLCYQEKVNPFDLAASCAYTDCSGSGQTVERCQNRLCNENMMHLNCYAKYSKLPLFGFVESTDYKGTTESVDDLYNLLYCDAHLPAAFRVLCYFQWSRWK